MTDEHPVAQPGQSSVLDQLRFPAWSGEEAVGYIAAVESAHAAIGACTAHLSRFVAGSGSNVVHLARWLAVRAKYVRWREELYLADHAQVRHLRQRFTALARRIRAGRPATVTKADAYLLPEVENRRIFDEDIVPELLSGRTPQDRPTVVLVTGQSGSGKTLITKVVAGALHERGGGFIDVDGDLYRTFHPGYGQPSAHGETLISDIRPDGRKWKAQAHAYVREHRLNAVIPEASPRVSAAAGTLRAYRKAGFRVEVLALAVPTAMSYQGIVNRYHEQVKERGCGRLNTQPNADVSYRGVLDLADLVDRQGLADQVGVYRRGDSRLRYRNTLNRTGHWRDPPGLRAAIEAERARPWNEQESADFLATQGRLIAELDAEGQPWIERIQAAAQPLMHRTEVYARWVAGQTGAVRTRG